MYIFIIIWGSWFLSEILLTALLRSKSPASKGWDKNSLRLVWGTIILSISLGVIVAIFTRFSISRSDIIRYLGLFCIVVGIFFRVIAIRTLGIFFTVNLAIHNDHHLIKKGLYKFIRHPSYTGSLLSFIGLGASFNNWLSLIVIVIPVFLAFIYRIYVEEKLLIKQFGSEYSEYMKSTKRLIPFIY
jgi:protein-S-isoprenylcysteine O-methyltransferase Ste14